MLELAQLNQIELPRDYVAKLRGMFNCDLYISMPNHKMPGLNDSGDTTIVSWMEKATGHCPQQTAYAPSSA